MSALIISALPWRSYADSMGSGAQPPGKPLAPLRRPASWSRYEGQWIAVVGDRVVAHGETSRELASHLKVLGPEGREAVMQFVSPPVNGYVIGPD